MHAPLRTKTIIFVLLLALTCIIYWPARFDYIRKDHWGYVAESFQFSNSWDWFLHSLNYTRTRSIAPGDYFLFRPALYFIAAVQDIFFRPNTLLTGLLSFSYLALGGLSLFLVTRRILDTATACALAIFYVTQVAGYETIAWRHVSPYLLSSVCALLAIHILAQKPRLASLSLLVGMLFHETAALGTLLFLVVGFVLHWTGNRDRRRFLLVMATSLAAYAILNMLDFALSGTPSVFGPADRSFGIDLLLSAAEVSFNFFGATARAIFLFPSVEITAPRPWQVARWIYAESPHLNLLGAVIGLAVIASAWPALRRAQVPALFSVCMLVSFVVALGVGRGALRGDEYLQTVTYYYALTSLFWLVLVSYPLAAIAGTTHRSAALTCVLALLALAQGVQTRQAIARNYIAEAAEINRLIPAVTAALEQHSYCFGGLSPRIKEELRILPFYFSACDGKIPAILDVMDGGWRLVPLQRSTLAAETALYDAPPVALSQNSNYIETGQGYRAKANVDTLPGEMKYMTLIESYTTNRFMVEIYNPDIGDISIDTRSGERLHISYDVASIWIDHEEKGGGKVSEINYRVLTCRRGKNLFEIVPFGGNIYVFVNDTLTTFVEGAPPIDGKIGIVTTPGSPRQQSFGPPRMGQQHEDPFDWAAAVPLRL